jgi:hypothetical protein
MEMDVICDPDSEVMHKWARTAEERRRLDHEAAVLAAVAHPGVVQLVGVEGGDPPEGLMLRRVGGGDLTTLQDPPVEVVAGLGAALATTIADLHDVGVSHGAIEAAHVLLDEAGRPVLCSFGRAERDLPPSRAEVARQEDVRALARMLLQRLPPGAPNRATRALRTAAGPGRQHRCREARWLARQLVSTIPSACLPTPGSGLLAGSQGPGQPGPVATASAPVAFGRHRRRAAVAAGCLLVGAAVALLTVRSVTAHRLRSGQPPAPGIACPPVDEGCAPVGAPGGYLTAAAGRYQVGLPGDVIVLGRWWCGPVAAPAVLRPSTGQVWTFDAWPTAAQPQVGRLAGRIKAAWSLRVLPQPSGCDRLEIDRRGMPASTIGLADP